MNSKGIIAIKNEKICMKCLNKDSTHTYDIYGRGYGSIYDSFDTKFHLIGSESITILTPYLLFCFNLCTVPYFL